MSFGAVPLNRSLAIPGKRYRREFLFSHDGGGYLDINRGRLSLSCCNNRMATEGESCSFSTISPYFKVLNWSSTRSTKKSRITCHEIERSPLKAMSKGIRATFRTEKSRRFHSLRFNFLMDSYILGKMALLDLEAIRTRADVKSEPYDISETILDAVNFPQVVNEVALPEDDLQNTSWWEQFPKRWVIVILCFWAFLLCNMDRVNMSIAILPMSAEFNWSPSTVGLIQSSFFWGYLLTQIAGGIWADTVGGKLVLGFGVIWWSIATVLTPIAAKLGLPFLLVTRALMGIGEGVAMPAMNNILSKWIPVAERSRSLAVVYSGMYLGSVTGLAFSPFLIHKFGWPSVFYSFGSLGTVWFAVWLNKAHSSPLEDPQLLPEEKKFIIGSSVSKEPVKTIPWRLILSKAPVWALIVSHFCHNWGTFILLTWMPTYYNQVLKFDLTESGLFCVLPWLTMAFSANLGGWIADTLISKGLSITVVRKIMQSIGFLGPAFFLTQLSHIHSPAMAVLCMACSQGTDAFSQSGLYSNHQDIGPRYAGVLVGLSNTAGVLAGVFGTAATGYILQHGSWDDVFKVAVGLYLTGTVVWNLFSTGEKILD